MFCDVSSPLLADRNGGVCVAYMDLGGCVCIHAYTI